MIKTIQSLTVTSKINQSDWYFIPNMLSGTLGIMIGFVIAQHLGLVEIANLLR